MITSMKVTIFGPRMNEYVGLSHVIRHQTYKLFQQATDTFNIYFKVTEFFNISVYYASFTKHYGIFRIRTEWSGEKIND